MTTVLVVDDSRQDQALTGGLLKSAGFEVIFAENGRHALELLAQQAVDIVVTDLQMDGLDGLELVAAIRERYPSIPVILVTGQGSEEIAVKALQAGAAGYVTKRNRARDLVPTVNNLLAVAQAKNPELQVLDWMVRSESEFVLDNDVTVIPPLVNYLEGRLTRMRLIDETARIQVGVALREALVNAMYHGNLEVPSSLREGLGNAFFDMIAERRKKPPYRRRRVHVTARETRAEVTYVVTDEGPGFDPSTLPDPTDPSQLENVSGRGLLLIRTFMDEIRHNARGNEITMIKRIDRGPMSVGRR